MNLLTFIILSLAVYRLTHLLVIDKIFEPIRRYFVIRNFASKPFPTYTVQGGVLRRFIGKMLVCHWCSGIWVAAVIAFGFYRPLDIKTSIILTFALASVQSLIETKWMKSVGYPDMEEVKNPLIQTAEEDDPLSAARGIINGIIISSLFWVALGVFIAYVL
ncbi:hypothetical protein PAECIP111891_04236 [Paenibacillus allorhizoplanae]|uniref:DUF1360 domain-containing protein n=1 Tax=Paenibacillus allorhizoplanae TaxID=2905648 RepID=A0ABM9CIE2_9BACL|nr:DUF1360 domain-containing protein [Paenibacillus allorhizoplanae]CAH1215240.1 hypothetical protein PAECIP111891_04236 [Paenibacillus allorhizoplanae]